MICTPRHWLVPFKQITLGALPLPISVVLGIILATIAPGVLWLQVVLWLMVLGHVSYVAYCVLSWRHDKIMVTDKRIIRVSGLFTTTESKMKLVSITDTDHISTFLGKLFGYGTIRLESPGQTQSLEYLTYMPSHRLVLDLVEAGMDPNARRDVEVEPGRVAASHTTTGVLIRQEEKP